ncbi:MAG: DMT family transporter [Candidatus Eremiobacteraeota bacterium]|nr:DMT family transporter [Candidatus Eremiobacteraeota bacterium]
MQALLAILYVFLWASAFIPSRILCASATPLWVLVIRFGITGALLIALVLVLRAPLPRSPREWGQIVLLGALANAIYLGLSYEALRHLSAGMGAIIFSTNPLVLALIAPLAIGERLTRRKALGLVCGFGGVVAMMLGRAGSPTAQVRDELLLFVAVICFALSTLVYKRIRPDADLRVVTAFQIAAASLVLVPFALLLEPVPFIPRTGEIVVSFVYLIFAISIGASFLWFWILRHGEATRVSSYYFLTPVFGLGLAALLLREPVRWDDGLGLLAICSGIALVVRSPKTQPEPEPLA